MLLLQLVVLLRVVSVGNDGLHSISGLGNLACDLLCNVGRFRLSGGA